MIGYLGKKIKILRKLTDMKNIAVNLVIGKSPKKNIMTMVAYADTVEVFLSSETFLIHQDFLSPKFIETNKTVSR